MKTTLAYISALALASALFLWPSPKLETAALYPYAFQLTGDGMVLMADVHTGEKLSIVYRDSDGIYNESALDAIDRLLRCHGDQEMYPISLKLIELIDNIQDNFGADEVQVVSGYRSPEYNEALRHKLKRVAHDSLHMQGLAMDIKLPGVDKEKLGRYARSLESGGVGVYHSSSFVHVDVGAVRSW